jgi:hypothetical protein
MLLGHKPRSDSSVSNTLVHLPASAYRNSFIGSSFVFFCAIAPSASRADDRGRARTVVVKGASVQQRLPSRARRTNLRCAVRCGPCLRNVAPCSRSSQSACAREGKGRGGEHAHRDQEVARRRDDDVPRWCGGHKLRAGQSARRHGSAPRTSRGVGLARPGRQRGRGLLRLRLRGLRGLDGLGRRRHVARRHCGTARRERCHGSRCNDLELVSVVADGGGGRV